MKTFTLAVLAGVSSAVDLVGPMTLAETNSFNTIDIDTSSPGSFGCITSGSSLQEYDVPVWVNFSAVITNGNSATCKFTVFFTDGDP